VRVFSRDEFKQYHMRKQFPMVDYVIGDIRDPKAVRSAMTDCCRVVHTAALKHVRTGEERPREAIMTNVLGTENVIEAARVKHIERLVFLSTDKACATVNTYGATKMLAERLVMQAGYNAVRYGNVMGSRGSVLHVFNEIEHGGVFPITDQRMTRFAVTLDYAVQLVDYAFESPPGNVVVGKPPTFRIVDLVEAFHPGARIAETGVQAGEKLHEALLTEYEAARAIDEGDHFLLRQDAGGQLPCDIAAFTSGTVKPMSVEEIREMIREVTDGGE
jgi:UDP-N-acetylglucosamine 4,6-dehydratase